MAATGGGQKHLYKFGDFSLDAENRVLLRGGETVPLQPKAADLLLLLVERRGEVLSKDELMQRLWPDSFVEEANLSQNIYLLRKAPGQGEGFIKTVPKRGYRFVADVAEISGSGEELIFEEHTASRITVEEHVGRGEPEPALSAWQAASEPAPREDRFGGRRRSLVLVMLGALLARMKVEPGLDPLRSDPRYADLLRRIGLEP